MVAHHDHRCASSSSDEGIELQRDDEKTQLLKEKLTGMKRVHDIEKAGAMARHALVESQLLDIEQKAANVKPGGFAPLSPDTGESGASFPLDSIDEERSDTMQDPQPISSSPADAKTTRLARRAKAARLREAAKKKHFHVFEAMIERYEIQRISDKKELAALKHSLSSRPPRDVT